MLAYYVGLRSGVYRMDSLEQALRVAQQCRAMGHVVVVGAIAS